MSALLPPAPHSRSLRGAAAPLLAGALLCLLPGSGASGSVLPGDAGQAGEPDGRILILDLYPHLDHVHAGSMREVGGSPGGGDHPHFLDPHRLIFTLPGDPASGEPPSLVLFDDLEDRREWVRSLPAAGVGPRSVPGGQGVTVIHVATGGTGREDQASTSPPGGSLHRYDPAEEGPPAAPTPLFPELDDIQAHAWVSPERAVLVRGIEGEPLPVLYLADLPGGEPRRIQGGVGPWLEPIPGTSAVGFEDRSDPTRPVLRRLDGATGEVSEVAELPMGGGEVAWLSPVTALLLRDGTLFRSTGDAAVPWHPILELEPLVGPVSGLAVAPAATLRIAVVTPPLGGPPAVGRRRGGGSLRGDG